MWLCRTHLQEGDERERERERVWQRDWGGCVPRWERKTQQALSRRTKEISNVWRPIVPIKADRSGIIWHVPIISIDCQIHPWSCKAMFSRNIFTLASRKKKKRGGHTYIIYTVWNWDIWWSIQSTRLLYVMTETTMKWADCFILVSPSLWPIRWPHAQYVAVTANSLPLS